MVYQQKLVAVIKCNGKILREVDNIVSLPFKSEYEIFIKNLESREVVVSINIDGQDVLDNKNIIIRANSNCSLEGFLKNNKVTNKFKFIQKTKEIQNHRGDKIDDSLIRIEYRFVKLHQTIITQYNYHPTVCDCPMCIASRSQLSPLFQSPNLYICPEINYYNTVSKTTFTTPSNLLGGSIGKSEDSILLTATTSNADNIQSNAQSNAFLPQFDEGITVKGSESNQKFEQTYTSPLEEQSYVIVLKLRGINKENQSVQTPVLIKSKIKCSTCGRKFKSHIKYCHNCGTALF